MAITKSIRNRLVGVLVILSLILILVPLLNPSKTQDGAQNEVDKEAIAASLTAKFGKKKPEILELNLKALEKGIELGKAHKV